MYIKKRTLILLAVLLIIATSVIAIGIVNPFGFTHFLSFLKFDIMTDAIEDKYYADVPVGDYVNSAISGFAEGTGDPYTDFLYGDEADAYYEDISGSFEGIGVYIENNTEDNTITVVSAIANSPAEEVGIVSGDKILAVSGVNYTGEQLNEAVKNMKGQSGTTVDVTVLKAATGETVTLTVERRHIDVTTVTSKMIEGTHTGYIAISQFTETTGEEFRKHIAELTGSGAKDLVIDLRNNPGGYVDAAVDVASNFVKSGEEVVYTLDKDGEKESYTSQGSQYYLPLAVLINQGTASSGEILTGALKDYGLARVIGEKSYGKGIVQEVFEGIGGIASVTIARYYTPNGSCIHEIGIEPDETIAMEMDKYAHLDELTLSEDEQLSAAVNYLNNRENGG